MGQRRINGGAYLLLVGRPAGIAQPLAVMQKLSLAVQFGIADHRQVMLQTHPVREPPEGKAGAEKIAVFPGTVQRCGIVVNMDVGMGPVNMGNHEKGVFPFCPAHSRFIADGQRLLRGQFTGREGLADLIAQHIGVPLLLPACYRLILGLAQKKFRVGGHRVALIGADQSAVQSFLRVLPIVETVREGL